MRCEETQELLQAYVDNDLPNQTQEEVRAHILACAQCGREAKKHARLLKLLQSQPMLEQPIDLVPKVVAKIKAARAVTLRGVFWKIGVAAAAACLLLAIFVGHHGQVKQGTKERVAQQASPPLAQRNVPPAPAPTIDVALRNVMDLLYFDLAPMHDYSEDLAGGIQWLTEPVASYITDLLTPGPDELTRTSLG